MVQHGSATRFASFLTMLLATAACSGERPEGGSSSGPNQLGGYIETVPEVDGAWRFTAADLNDLCGIDGFSPGDERILQIAQADTQIAFTVSDACGDTVAEGIGIIHPGGLTTLSYDESRVVNKKCSLDLTVEIVGTADTLGQTIGGSFTLTATPIGEDHECGVPDSCDVTGTFLARSCPPASCKLPPCES